MLIKLLFQTKIQKWMKASVKSESIKLLCSTRSEFGNKIGTKINIKQPYHENYQYKVFKLSVRLFQVSKRISPSAQFSNYTSFPSTFSQPKAKHINPRPSVESYTAGKTSCCLSSLWKLVWEKLCIFHFLQKIEFSFQKIVKTKQKFTIVHHQKDTAGKTPCCLSSFWKLVWEKLCISSSSEN